MQLENTLTVPADVDIAWAIRTDLEDIAPCMPGTTLTSRDGDRLTANVR